MARRTQSKGDCIYCGSKMTRSGMSKHLQACPKKKEIISTADAKKGQNEVIFHLMIHDLWQPDYWLHVEMPGKSKLADLDHYLRAIWLECCGHLSQFSLGKWGDKIAMSRRAGQIFGPGMELFYVYDFGTSSDLGIRVVASRTGKPLSPHPITLMARNNLPEKQCMECGELASWLCLECIFEYNEPGELCDTHAKEHPHEEYGEPIPLVNSPRIGMCGYTGPAAPPY